jgi:DNA polymerase (family 10)
MSLNIELSDLFRNFAGIMEIRGENPFKAIAFSKVSRILKDLTFDIRTAVEENRVDEIEGIGESSRRIIEQYVREGKSTDYEQVCESVPPGLAEMLSIPGMGPKTIALLWKERKITSIDELLKAIEEGKLAGVKGLGPKKIESIKEGIAMRATASLRRGIAEVMPIAEAMVEKLKALKNVKAVQYAGSLRRGKETIGDVDLVASVKSDPESVAAAFVKMPEVEKILGQGSTKASVLTWPGLQIDLRIVPVENFGAALLYFTGSKDHNIKLRGMAQDNGWTLNEWGLYDAKAFEKAKKETGSAPELEPLAGKTEESVYKKLGLEFIEPELREDRGEVDLARQKKLPDLICIKDVRGDLHTHTTASDGSESIQSMAEAAAARGYEYLAITDHSKSQVIARGLTAERLLKHVAEIRKASGKYGVKLLAGCEVDILIDGRLDFEEAILAELDYVVASPHISLKQDETKATDRILRAVETKYVNVIGHPTGRLINGRAGLPVNFSKIFKVAASTGTAMEINSGWPRLDLNDVNARAALEAGVMLSINTDAHSLDDFNQLHWGITVARRAGATKESVINCMTFGQLQKFIARKR